MRQGWKIRSNNVKKCLSHIENFKLFNRKKGMFFAIRGISAMMICPLLFFCSGDGCKNAFENVFEGWERPVLIPPSETSTELLTEYFNESQDIQTEVSTVGSTVVDTIGDTVGDTVVDTVGDTEEIEEKTEDFSQDETDASEPYAILDPMKEEGGTVVYAVRLCGIPEGGFRGVLLILTSDEGCQILKITQSEHTKSMNFTYVVRDDTAAVLLDGKDIFRGDHVELCHIYIKGSICESRGFLTVDIKEII